MGNPADRLAKVLDSSRPLRYRLNYPWELATLPGGDLKPGDILHYYVTVTDNYDLENLQDPTGPHLTHPAVASGKLRITIISQEDLNNAAMEQTHQVSAKVEELKKAQETLRVATMQLQDEIKNKKEFEEVAPRAEQNVTKESTIASQTKQLSDQLKDIEKRLNDNKSNNQELITCGPWKPRTNSTTPC